MAATSPAAELIDEEPGLSPHVVADDVIVHKPHAPRRPRPAGTSTYDRRKRGGRRQVEQASSGVTRGAKSPAATPVHDEVDAAEAAGHDDTAAEVSVDLTTGFEDGTAQQENHTGAATTSSAKASATRQPSPSRVATGHHDAPSPRAHAGRGTQPAQQQSPYLQGVLPVISDSRGGPAGSHPPASPLRTSQAAASAKAARRRRLAAQRREKVLNSTPYAQVQRPRPYRAANEKRSPGKALGQQELSSRLVKASRDGDSFSMQLKQFQKHLKSDLRAQEHQQQRQQHEQRQATQGESADGSRTETTTPAGVSTKEDRAKVQGDTSAETATSAVLWPGDKSGGKGGKASKRGRRGRRRRSAASRKPRSGLAHPRGRASAPNVAAEPQTSPSSDRHASTQPTLPSSDGGDGSDGQRAVSNQAWASEGGKKRISRKQRRAQRQARREERLEAGFQLHENRFMTDVKDSAAPAHTYSIVRLPSATAAKASVLRKDAVPGQGGAVAVPVDEQVQGVIAQYEGKIASLTSRHAARVAVMNGRLRRMEKAVASAKKTASNAQMQAKRHRKRVAELQELLSRVMPEREEAIARASTLQKQFKKEIQSLQESLQTQRKHQQTSAHMQAESDRVVGKLLVHLESDVASISSRRPTRGSHGRSPASSAHELKRQQRLQKQRDLIHRLEWDLKRKQAQVVQMRHDQEAALVDVRVALGNEFRGKQLEWAREKDALVQRLQRLEQETRNTGGSVPLIGAKPAPTSQLSPVLEGQEATLSPGAEGGAPLRPVVEYKPSQRHTEKSREDIKQMRRFLGAAQTVYKAAHTINTRYVVISMLWRNTTRRRLAVSAFEPETNVQRTATYSDDVLGRRFDFDTVRSLRCMPSLSASRRYQVGLTVVDRLEVVEDEDTQSWELRLQRRVGGSHGAGAEVSDEALYASTQSLLSGEDAHVHVQWSPVASERLQATAQEASGNFLVTRSWSDAELVAAFQVEAATLAGREGCVPVAKQLAARLGVAAMGRDGVLVLCLLPRVAATLPGTVLVRLVHETASTSVHLSVAHDPESKALMFQSIVLETSKVSTLVVTKSELQPWRRTALGRVTTTPLEAMSVHDQQQVAMYAVAKLQFEKDGRLTIRRSAEPTEEGFVAPWEKFQPVLEKGIKLGRGYAIVRVHWSMNPATRLRLVCHNPHNSSEGVLEITDLQVQLAMQVAASVLVSAKQRRALAERVVRCIRWDGRNGPVSLAL